MTFATSPVRRALVADDAVVFFFYFFNLLQLGWCKQGDVCAA